ncbi:hypothetical protein [Paraburkholderia sp. SOS3]|uniref:hypothetical protein n=1 Tax=Paraburkholderia sp. SOS3 TaxID=1926494 RepID=UPI0009476C45|nr:hypothetical protein [Paraburkholderia sp. SOS3]APR40021.1 hypothetical protein BTO02_33310 [Paraburkholderia sp. SOS3]
MAAVTPLAAIAWNASEVAASQTLPSVVDLAGMQSAMLNDLEEIIKNVNYLISILPSGTNKTTLTTLASTLA